MQFVQDLMAAICCISYGLSVAQLLTAAFFAALKNRKGHTTALFAVVCPYFVIDLVSNICTTQSAYYPLGGLL